MHFVLSVQFYTAQLEEFRNALQFTSTETAFAFSWGYKKIR